MILDPISKARWVRLTILGWLLGMVFVITIALVSEVVGLRAAQLPVGLGMGLGVGLAQERALAALIHDPRKWRWASAAGLAFPFFIVDLSRLLGTPTPYSLYGGAAIAGITAGACQACILRPHGISAPLWIVVSTLGWAAAAQTVAGADSMIQYSSMRGLSGAVLYLIVVATGGMVLGLITSVPLSRLRKARPSVRPDD